MKSGEIDNALGPVSSPFGGVEESISFPHKCHQKVFSIAKLRLGSKTFMSEYNALVLNAGMFSVKVCASGSVGDVAECLPPELRAARAMIDASHSKLGHIVVPILLYHIATM